VPRRAIAAPACAIGTLTRHPERGVEIAFEARALSAYVRKMYRWRGAIQREVWEQRRCGNTLCWIVDWLDGDGFARLNAWIEFRCGPIWELLSPVDIQRRPRRRAPGTMMIHFHSVCGKCPIYVIDASRLPRRASRIRYAYQSRCTWLQQW